MKKTNQQIAIEVIAGRWGNGSDRRTRLSNAGYDPDAVQSIVNALMSGNGVELPTVTGTETYEVTIDLTKYNQMNVTLLFGEEE